MFSRQHHEDPMMGQLRAEIAGLDARLAADVTGIDDGGDPVSRQALSDAGERMQAARGMKASATTVGELRIVCRPPRWLRMIAWTWAEDLWSICGPSVVHSPDTTVLH